MFICYIIRTFKGYIIIKTNMTKFTLKRRINTHYKLKNRYIIYKTIYINFKNYINKFLKLNIYNL